MKDKRRKPRWLQRIRAWLGAYFWLPCQLCGEYYGGHEWNSKDILLETPSKGRGVCANCGDEARRRNAIMTAPRKKGFEVLDNGSWVFHYDAGTINIGGGRFGL